ncbi:MAG: hypothetical protein ACKOPE_12090 [Novosphingobium sp.]
MPLHPYCVFFTARFSLKSRRIPRLIWANPAEFALNRRRARTIQDGFTAGTG